jgi:heparanase
VLQSISLLLAPILDIMAGSGFDPGCVKTRPLGYFDLPSHICSAPEKRTTRVCDWMMQHENEVRRGLLRAVSIGSVLTGLCSPAPSLAASSIVLAPTTMARLGSIDERFQSYNIEMVEVTGGHFWRPYSDSDKASSSSVSDGVAASMAPSVYAYRKPINFANPRLRRLAAALGPTYLRVSGTWANATYFDDTDGNAKSPPGDFKGVSTRKQWKDVIEFARAVDARLVTSFATSPGTRDARGVWTPAQANKLIAYTHALGGRIAAAEFMNEPSGDDAANYGRDISVFRPFLKRASPETIFLGPGASSGDRADSAHDVENLLAASGPVFDAVSYHYYSAASQRAPRWCRRPRGGMRTRFRKAGYRGLNG